MCYYIRELVSECEANYLFGHSTPINVRRCRDCEYFISELPPASSHGINSGYCEFRTQFNCFDDGAPIDWYFTDENGFCNEDDLK